MLLILIARWILGRYSDMAGLVLFLGTMVPLLLIWGGCFAELVAGGMHRLMDPQDDRPFDTNKHRRDLDMIASLVQAGKKEEAIQLCLMLKESGDANVLAMETMLEHLGVHQENAHKPKPLVDAYQLRSLGKFHEAETILKSLLAENPSNAHAALMLIRLYAQDLHQSDKAMEVLLSLARQPYVSAGHLEFARRSIAEWSQPGPTQAPEPAMPESVDELLACGYLGTAIEILEQKAAEKPDDFDLQLKLAEAHGLHSGNVRRAKKIIEALENQNRFSAEQIQSARVKLDEWREAAAIKRV